MTRFIDAIGLSLFSNARTIFKQFQGCERIQEQIFVLELVQGVKLSNQFTLRSEKRQSEVQDSDSDGQKKIGTADFVG